MATECQPAVQDLDSFQPDPDDIERARQWASTPDGTPDERLESISEQLEYHVTEIHGQRLLHVATDLIYHPVLHFRFGGSVVQRGWMELLAVGETRSGKSTTASKLLDLYQRGHYQSSENASVAGLLFGADKRLGSGRETWGGSAGVLPLNNRGPVALDEAQGLRTEQIAQMSDMRSRGVVQISKIRSAEVQAQVRLIWLANGRRERYGMGTDALKDQMGSSRGPSTSGHSALHQGQCRDRVGQGPKDTVEDWMRKRNTSCGGSSCGRGRVRQMTCAGPDRPATSSGSTARRSSEQFTTTIPIFQPNEAGVRLARMAVALAARLFSTPDGHRLVIKSEHIEAARRLYERFLGARELGLIEVKKQEAITEHAEEDYGGELREFLKNSPLNIRQQLVNGELSSFGFGATDAGGMYVSKLSGMHAIQYQNNKYSVAPWAVEIARNL